MDTLATAVLAEELGRSGFGGFAITVLVHTDMASPHLANAGNEAQLERYMPAVIAGECITAVAVTEPDAGSDVAGMRTRAVRDGDDFILDGAKLYITNGVNADLYCVAARTDPAGEGDARADHLHGGEGDGGLPGRAVLSTRWAGARRIPPNSSSRVAACRRRMCSARSIAVSTPS